MIGSNYATEMGTDLFRQIRLEWRSLNLGSVRQLSKVFFELGPRHTMLISLPSSLRGFCGVMASMTPPTRLKTINPDPFRYFPIPVEVLPIKML